jgi:hypothetical protein
MHDGRSDLSMGGNKNNLIEQVQVRMYRKIKVNSCGRPIATHFWPPLQIVEPLPE